MQTLHATPSGSSSSSLKGFEDDRYVQKEDLMVLRSESRVSNIVNGQFQDVTLSDILRNDG